MRYRTFGSKGWEVSELSLRAVNDGGVGPRLQGPEEVQQLGRRERVGLLLHAFERGVTLVETPPGGGDVEAVITEALEAWREPVRVAVEVSCDVDPSDRSREPVRGALEASLKRLHRERVDVVLLADVDADDLRRDDIVGALVDARARGEVALVGVSLRSPADAPAAVRHEAIDVVQVAFNLLDQRAAALFPEIEERGVALLLREPLLDGVLTSRRRLPERWSALRDAADRAERWAWKNGDDLTRGALRFCLAQRGVASVVVAAGCHDDLEEALAATESEPLHSHRLANADRLALDDEALVDPRRWRSS